MCGIFSIICMYVTSHPTLIFGNFRFCGMYVCIEHSLPQSIPVFQQQQSPTKRYKPGTFQMLQSHSFFLNPSTAFNCYVCFLELCSIYLLKSIALSSSSM